MTVFYCSEARRQKVINKQTITLEQFCSSVDIGSMWRWI